MKQVLSIIIVIFFSCNNHHQETTLFIDVTSEIVTPKHYIISKTDKPIIIDGVADESTWKSTIFSDSFIDIEGAKTPNLDTKFKMLWDEKYLYVYAIIEEPHIWGDLKQRDTIIYFNNDFEIFIDHSMSTTNYIEIEINALGTVWDLLMDKPYRVGGKAIGFWSIGDLKSAVQTHGSLNNPNDIDSFWTVEMAIPLKVIMEIKSRPKLIPVEGEQWRVNFSRVEWDFDIVNGKYHRKKEKGEFLKEYNWVWSPQGVINMHEPEKWGIVQFTNNSSTKGIVFSEDKDVYIKQAAYALFRQTRFGSLKDMLKQEVNSTKNVKVKFAENKTLIATFLKTNFGFEYKIESTVSQNIYVINEEGLLKVIK